MQDLEKRFGKVEVIKTDKGRPPTESPFKDIGTQLKQVSPMNFMNEQVKVIATICCFQAMEGL